MVPLLTSPVTVTEDPRTVPETDNAVAVSPPLETIPAICARAPTVSEPEVLSDVASSAPLCVAEREVRAPVNDSVLAERCCVMATLCAVNAPLLLTPEELSAPATVSVLAVRAPVVRKLDAVRAPFSCP